MIDVHSHILPGIDDGAQCLEDSAKLLKVAIDDGITHIVATPHIHPGRFDNNNNSISAAYSALLSYINEQKLAIKLSFGAEIRISPEILTMLTAGTIPFVGEWEGSSVMLLEMPHSHILPGSDKLINLLIKNNIRPLIAHPERNKEIMLQPEKIKPFVDSGCLLQVTAGSLCGRFGDKAQNTAEKLISDKLVTLIATDCHNEKNRPPLLAEGYDRIEKLIDKNYSIQLQHNVKTLVSNKPFNA
jgi:protein-tyrosine phosphatase